MPGGTAEAARGPDAAQAPAEEVQRTQSILLQMMPALGTQFDYNLMALTGQRPFDVFSGITGISGARAAQFESFMRGETGYISGTGLSESNLRRLEVVAEEAAAHGIQITVDMEGRRFEIANMNYIPLEMLSPEQQAALVSATLRAQEYLQAAQQLQAAGRADEAAAHVQRAAQIQEVYSTYVEALIGLRAVHDAYDNMDSAPRAGGSERIARRMVETITGTAVSDEQLASEFERVTGVAYDEFVVREEGGRLAGGGMSAIARHDYGEAMRASEAALSGLEQCFQGITAGRDVSQQFAESVSMLQQAGVFAAYGSAIMGNVYSILTAREGAEQADSIDFEGMFTVTRAVRPETPSDEVTVTRYERYVMPGFDRHHNGLEMDRRAMRSEYVAAESDFTEAVFYMAALPSTQEEAEENARMSQSRQAEGSRHLAEAGGMGERLRGRVTAILAYEPIRQGITDDSYATPLMLADPSGGLIRERDGISAQLDAAMRDGTTVENLDVQLRSLEYSRIASSWERFQFPDVRGAGARSELDATRDVLVADLRAAAREGREMADLDLRRARIGGAYEEALNFEQAVTNVVAGAYVAAERMRIQAGETAERLRGVLGQVPDRFTYTEKAGTDSAAKDVTEDLTAPKNNTEAEIRRAEGYSQEIAGRQRALREWSEGLISSYSPSTVVVSDSQSLERRYGLSSGAAFAGYRDVVDGLGTLGRDLRISLTTASQYTMNVVELYDQGMARAQHAERMAAGIDLADPVGWALGGFGVRAGQFAISGARALWTHVTTRALQEGAVGLAYRAAELSARATPTLLTVMQNSYAGYRIATADTLDEAMEGAMFVGAFGSTGGLVGIAGRGARYFSIAMDSLAVGAIAVTGGMAVARAADRGGDAWWDFAGQAGMGAFGMFGAGMGLAGSMGIRVPGGWRNVLPGGLLRSAISELTPGGARLADDAARAAIEVGREFGPAPVMLAAQSPLQREQLAAAGRAVMDAAPASARAAPEAGTAALTGFRREAAEAEARLGTRGGEASVSSIPPSAEAREALVPPPPEVRVVSPPPEARAAMRAAEEARVAREAAHESRAAREARAAETASTLPPAAARPAAREARVAGEAAGEARAAGLASTLPPESAALRSTAPAEAAAAARPAAAEARAATEAAQEARAAREAGGPIAPVVDLAAARASRAPPTFAPASASAAFDDLQRYAEQAGMGALRLPEARAGDAVQYPEMLGLFMQRNPRVFELSNVQPMRVVNPDGAEVVFRFGQGFTAQDRVFMPVYVTEGGGTSLRFFYRSRSEASWRLAVATEQGQHLWKGSQQMDQYMLVAPSQVQHGLNRAFAETGSVATARSVMEFLPEQNMSRSAYRAAVEEARGLMAGARADPIIISSERGAREAYYPDFEHGVLDFTRGQSSMYGDYFLVTVSSANQEVRYNYMITERGTSLVSAEAAGEALGGAGLAGRAVVFDAPEQCVAPYMAARGVTETEARLALQNEHTALMYMPLMEYEQEVAGLREMANHLGYRLHMGGGRAHQYVEVQLIGPRMRHFADGQTAPVRDLIGYDVEDAYRMLQDRVGEGAGWRAAQRQAPTGTGL